jgi:hypothetical protein
MSADAPAPAPDDDGTVATTDYSSMLEDLDVAIAEARRKIESGRIKDVSREKARVKQWRALGYLIDIRRKVAEQRDLEELADEIEDLKAAADGEV